MPRCPTCATDFEISEKERNFLQKMIVPAPKLCPVCRQQRRLAYRNERTLYRRTCSLTGKNIISIYPQEAPFPVYEPDAWFSDKWNDLEYGREFDFNRPFFEQFYELQSKAPKLALNVMNLENSPYVNQCWYIKNAHLCFDAGFCEDTLYCYATYHSKNMIDTSFTYNSELSYELVDCQRCYQCMYLQDCNNCNDAYFSFDCNSCNNIAFCSNLRNQSYMILNKKVTPEEFAQFKNQMKKGSFTQFQKYVEKYNEVRKSALYRENHNTNTQECFGDYIRNSKNCTHSYDINESQDLHFCTRMDEKTKDSMDIDHGSLVEMAYEGSSVAGYNLRFGVMSLHSNNVTYFHTLKSCSNCFGCISLKNREYCILNKQYSKEEYEALVPRIIEHMKRTGEFGEFFPVANSPFAYNEAVAQEYFPMTDESAAARGYRWKQQDIREYKAQTTVLPDTIGEVPQNIIDEILACVSCRKNYKIIIQELEFYKKLGIPLPRMCSDCRHMQRKDMRGQRALFENKCAKCAKTIFTGYALDEGLKICCEACYLKEIY